MKRNEESYATSIIILLFLTGGNAWGGWCMEEGHCRQNLILLPAFETVFTPKPLENGLNMINALSALYLLLIRRIRSS